MSEICIEIGDLKVSAKLNDSETAKMISDALPIEKVFNTWGDEIYFRIPVKSEIEDKYANEVVELGDLGYWPQGNCFCIFYGSTPVSKDGEIRPASAVNVIGKVIGDTEVFKKVDKRGRIKVC